MTEPEPGISAPLSVDRRSLWAAAAYAGVVFLLLHTFWDLAVSQWPTILPDGDWWRFDWLLAGLLATLIGTSLLSVSPRRDLLTIAVGLAGGFVIESWGTRTELWRYFTGERPPLWILPAWGASSLAIERLLRLALARAPALRRRVFGDDTFTGPVVRTLYAAAAALSAGAFLSFAWPTLDKPGTLAIAAVLVVILWRPRYPAYAVGLFVTGSVLGIGLEYWGTTRTCWVYYNGQTPPLFPVLGHGLAAIAFWKAKAGIRRLYASFTTPRPARAPT